jgi:lysyl-tRNA synthetase class II
MTDPTVPAQPRSSEQGSDEQGSDEQGSDEQRSGEIGVRLGKRARLADPYPVGYPRTHTIAAVRGSYADLPPDTYTGQTVVIAGRVMRYRTSGKLCFATAPGTSRS